MILILGVTASGKGRLAYDLAQGLDAEIISIDSMKVYRRMDIGTAKPPMEARRRIKYHLIDIVEPSDSFSVGTFRDAVLDVMEQIKNRSRRIIAVGGTALYMKALLYGLFDGPGTDRQIRAELQEQADVEGPAGLHRELTKVDPVAAERINPNDSKRIIRALEVYKLTGKPISDFQQQWNKNDTQYAIRNAINDWTIIGLRRDKAEESRRINARVKKMIEAGLVDEVESLLGENKPLSKQTRCAIGYAEIIEHIEGKIELEDAIESIKKNTRRLAKNQRTWFRTFKNVNWLDIGPDETAEEILSRAKKMIE
ncbi:MAG: tRNA (adenosine(37)-N6)-dimethylallyltransferase MiaA [Sedimentisphaerales bacterium]|nr:tRNA (adenosine(37)-N6)-dimethylallyltransferase MiaA [Sedimentisphaerales bacterium]